MGLDWIAQAKADGTQPQQTLGMRRLSRDDPETIAEFRGIVESYREVAKDRPGTPMHDYWMRDFEVILDEKLEDPPFLAGTAKLNQPSEISGSFMCSEATSFRGKCVAFTGVSSETADRAYGEGDENEMSPEYALDYADELQRYVDDPGQLSEISEAYGDEVSVEDSIETLQEAVKYLRFWAERGHPIWCWY